MLATIRRLGNSQGVLIPKPLLKQVGLVDQAEMRVEGDALVLPSQAGGLDQTLQSVSDISNKLNQIPFKQIGDHLDQLLLTTDDTLESPQMKQSIADLAATLGISM